jgi:hypothetical protein
MRPVYHIVEPTTTDSCRKSKPIQRLPFWPENARISVNLIERKGQLCYTNFTLFEGGHRNEVHTHQYIFVISKRDFVRLDEILSMKGNMLKMKKYPFDIVFLS